jgi:replicative DNA helicase
VQHLLHRTGIPSTLRSVTSNKGYRTMYHVAVQGKENQLHFMQQIGCAGIRGKIIPRLVENLEKIETHTNYDVIPKEAWSIFVNPARIQKGLTWRNLAEKLGMSYCGSALFKSGISKERMQRLNEFLDDTNLNNLVTSNILWDEIMSINPLGVEDVYDATVEGVHNFMANDIFVHNSIEQDADIVMLLFRREYYDAHDKPGQAEVIIGKNRHGGVGSVNLTFRKEFAQFANYTPLPSQESRSNEDPFAALRS